MKTKLLLLLFLANFSIYAQTNLVPNGNFEIWTSSSQPDNWYRYFSGFVSQNSVAQNGSSSTNMMVASGTFNYINSEYFPVVAGKTYRVTLYHKLAKGTFSSIDFSLYHKPGTFKEEIIKKSDVTFSTSEWRKIEFDYTPTVSENVEVDIWTTGSLNSEILVDNISMVDVNEVPVQYTLIPDVNFEKKLIALGIDSGATDGKVLTSKVATLTTLSISNSSITDLTGIQDFKALTYLDVTNNKLGSIDVSKNTALKQLRTSWNPIKTLDVSKNVLLYELGCYSNDLTVLDLSANINLTNLQCSQNALTTLDVSKNTKLTVLICSSNKLQTVDTSKNPDLLSFECYQNQITSLDVSKNTNLNTFRCFSNKLTSLDLSGNPKLRILECEYNNLSALDVSKNPELTKLEANNNSNLSQVNLKNGKNTLIKASDLILTSNPSLTCIIVDDVTYSNTNWATSKESSADFSTTECAAPAYTLIPDINFERTLIKKGIDAVEDGKVLTKRIASITILNLSDYYTNLKIEDLTGLQDFAALEELTLPNNGNGILTSIDVSKNLKLKKLNCNSNKLASLDVSKNLALTDLNVYYNNLTTLDVSKNLELKTLTCSLNRLTTLDVSKNLALKELYAEGSNKEGSYSSQQGLLTTIDLSKNLELERLSLASNEKIVNLDVSKNIKLKHISVNGNGLTTVDFSANPLLESLYCSTNKLTSLDLSKYPALTTLDCSYNQIKTIDVSQKTNLKFLNVWSNELTSLDVSKNTALERIYCPYNKLTTLDLSNNPNLLQVLCTGNNLMKLNLKNGGNTKMTNQSSSLFGGNPNLTCILVDDVAYSNANWSSFKDQFANYNTECEFSLGPKNFAIESKGETCTGENNGQITVTATAQLPYTATVNGTSKTFVNNSLQITNLAPGTYTVIIAVTGETYEQTFNIVIPKAATIAGKSTIASKKVEVEITEGTAPFTVFVNGEAQFQTTDSNFSLELDQAGLVEVATSKACEGIFAKKVSSSELGTMLSAYPNPTSDNVEIEIPNSKSETVIEIFNFGGQVVSKGTYNTENGTAYLNLANLPSGIYAAKIYLETPEYVKIIKK
ncbi:Por secretion system C-terminal sorting domain-containing protein [Flavobacterium resistens]|uniref:Por secretion system C-terminal sorting domain-containing protein n=1 Tax=Flavobacterium resistens TaxID=443612 RepID=A0A521C5R0_9FLAO|nr:leucine-rich repeat domain-containing protein [Flavobacterium resistens]SMO54786.1 Por secretion system C-terminal sorting domain-containing protein [Flavobacterium resistens]